MCYQIAFIFMPDKLLTDTRLFQNTLPFIFYKFFSQGAEYIITQKQE